MPASSKPSRRASLTQKMTAEDDDPTFVAEDLDDTEDTNTSAQHQTRAMKQQDSAQPVIPKTPAKLTTGVTASRITRSTTSSGSASTSRSNTDATIAIPTPAKQQRSQKPSATKKSTPAKLQPSKKPTVDKSTSAASTSAKKVAPEGMTKKSEEDEDEGDSEEKKKKKKKCPSRIRKQAIGKGNVEKAVKVEEKRKISVGVSVDIIDKERKEIAKLVVGVLEKRLPVWVFTGYIVPALAGQDMKLNEGAVNRNLKLQLQDYKKRCRQLEKEKISLEEKLAHAEAELRACSDGDEDVNDNEEEMDADDDEEMPSDDEEDLVMLEDGDCGDFIIEEDEEEDEDEEDKDDGDYDEEDEDGEDKDDGDHDDFLNAPSSSITNSLFPRSLPAKPSDDDDDDLLPMPNINAPVSATENPASLRPLPQPPAPVDNNGLLPAIPHSTPASATENSTSLRPLPQSRKRKRNDEDDAESARSFFSFPPCIIQ